MSAAPTTEGGTWTAALRDRLSRTVPEGQVLPDRQPRTSRPGSTSSACSPWPRWSWCSAPASCSPSWAAPPGGTSRAFGHFVNSLHLWSVELFFACMVIHLWGKFWMAAWRGKRG